MTTHERIGRMLIVCFVLLGVFVVLLGLTPSGFFISTREYEQAQTPTVWHGIDIQSFKETKPFVLNTSLCAVDFDIGGRNMLLEEVLSGGQDRIHLAHAYGIGLQWNEAMDWYNKNGIKISWQYLGWATIGSGELNSAYAQFGDLGFTVKCEGKGYGSSRFQVGAIFNFNLTLYDTPKEAWENNDLDLLIGIDFDNTNTAFNAWNIVSMLLGFQSLEIFGASGTFALALNLIVALPLWACIAYIAFRIVTAVIPLLGG